MRKFDRKGILAYIFLGLAFLFAMLGLTSCVTYEKCYDKYGVMPGDSIPTPVSIEVPVYIQVRPDSAKLKAALDSLLAGRVIENDTVNAKDSSTIGIKIWYDKNTNSINAQAKQKGYTFRDTFHYYDTIPVIAPPMLIKPLTWKEKTIGLYMEFAAWTWPILFGVFMAVIGRVINGWTRKRYIDNEL